MLQVVAHSTNCEIASAPGKIGWCIPDLETSVARPRALDNFLLEQQKVFNVALIKAPNVKMTSQSGWGEGGASRP